MLAPYRAVMETNYFAAVAGTLAVLPGMLERRHGAIVNVSSDSARAPGPGEPAYCASKAALSAFTECQALTTDGSGVHIHVLYPGWVPTAMGNEAIERGMPMPPKFVRRSEERVSRLLMSRIGSGRIDIDAAPIARLAPVARSLAPGAYKRGVLKTSGYAAK
jgi:NAD(P)-dependent dehydrogenase (short-subunit alcohol dehydrogenase family)